MKTEVLLSSYNGVRYMQEQLDSIRLQSMQPNYVTIIDDCSTDSSYSFLVDYVHDNNLRWHIGRNAVNLGWKENFGRMLLSSEGDLVFPCDQDDIWNWDKIEIMTSVMLNNPEIDVLASTVTPFYEEGSKKSYSDTTRNESSKYIELFSDYPRLLKVSRPGCTYCVRKSYIEELKDIWDLSKPHDMQLWTYSAIKGTLGLLNEPLVRFRRHSSNASTRKRSNAKDRAQILCGQMADVKHLLSYIDKTSIEYFEKYEMLLEMQSWLDTRIALLNGNRSLSTITYLIRHMKYYPSYKSMLIDLLNATFPKLLL